MSNRPSTGAIAISRAAARAASCISNRSPAKPLTIFLSRLRMTSKAKVTPVPAAIARMSLCTGLSSISPQVARWSPIRAALCSVKTVSRPARPGATSFGPPLKPAKKCGSTKPVVTLISASAHKVFSQTGTPLPNSPVQVSEALSRASWLTMCSLAASSSPSICRISSSVLPRWVPVATSTTMSSGSMMPATSSRMAGIIRSRGCGRVRSHIEIAMVCPGFTRSRSRRPAIGLLSTSRR